MVSPAWQEGAREALKAVQDIDLHRFTSIEDAPAARVFHSCPHARTINIFGCRKLGACSFAAIAESCPELRSLNLTGNPNATTVLLDKIVSSCASLDSLYLA